MGSPNLRSSLITLRSSHSIPFLTLFITANSLNQRDHFVIIEKCITIRFTHNSLKVIFQRSPVHERNHCALLGNNTGIGRGCERTVYCSHQPRRRAAAASWCCLAERTPHHSLAHSRTTTTAKEPLLLLPLCTRGATNEPHRIYLIPFSSSSSSSRYVFRCSLSSGACCCCAAQVKEEKPAEQRTCRGREGERENKLTIAEQRTNDQKTRTDTRLHDEHGNCNIIWAIYNLFDRSDAIL